MTGRKSARTLMTLLTAVMLVVAVAERVVAESADPSPFLLMQPDGSSFMARQWGDERSHGFETLQGHSVVRDTAGRWNYAVRGSDDRLRSGGVPVGLGGPPPSSMNLRPRSIGPAKTTSREVLFSGAGGQGLEAVPGEPSKVVPPAGTGNVPVILINYSDRSTSHTNTQIDNVIFLPANNSSRDYYEEVSYGAFSISSGPSGVAGWYVAVNGHDYYGANDINGNDEHPAELVIEAVAAADPTFDFAPYDQDGDCYVDVVSIIYQGTPENVFGHPSTDIWPHRWNLFSANFFGDGAGRFTTNDDCIANPARKVVVDDYTVQAEVRDLSGNIMTIGTFTHEYGHALGLPDLYDTNGGSNGVGRWSLMASGSHNGVVRSGDSPAHPDPWSKYRLGWVAPTAVTTELTNESVQQASAAGDVYRLLAGTPLTGEYFLVENRQQSGFDAGLPGAGLLIWHVDTSVSTNRDPCYPGGPDCSLQHYKVALEQADGQWHLEKPASNRGDTGDPYPGSTGNTSFHSATTPSSDLYDGTATAVSVTAIGASGPAMTATMTTTSLKTLTVTKTGSGGGTVTSNPVGINCGVDCTEDYADATAVDLTATPSADSVFSGWSGDADCADGSVTMNANVSCTAAFAAQVDIQLTAAESADPVVAGSGLQNLVYTVTASNSGPADATGVAIDVSQTRPAGVSLDSAIPSAGSFAGGTWTLGDLAAAASATLTVSITVGPSTAAGTDVVDCTASLGSVNESDTAGGNDSATAATSVQRQVDIGLTMSESADPVVAGSGALNLVYTVTAANVGPSDASGVAVAESLTLPAGVTLNSAVPSAGTYGGGTWTLGPLADGASETLTVSVTAGSSAAAGTDVVTSSASVSSVNETDTDGGNDAAAEATSVRRRVDLALSKTESVDPVATGPGGADLTFVVTLANSGPSDASGISLAEDLTVPAGVTVDSVTPSTGTFTPTIAPDGTWTVGGLSVGGTATLTVVMTVAQATTPGTDVISDTAAVAAVNEFDTNLGNNSVTESTSVTSTADLTVVLAGSGSGTVTSSPAGIDCGTDCTEAYAGGQTVTLTAAADTGSVFGGWSGDPDCADGAVDMTTNLSCTAAFNVVQHSLSIALGGAGTGTVTSSPTGIDCGTDCGEDYDYGTSVTLLATAGGHSLFAGWAGDGDCADGAVVMDVDVNCTATFNTLGDWNGDGRPDMVWRDPVSGRNALLYLDGASREGVAFLPTAPLEWSNVAAADFDRDGSMDILWRHATSGASVVSYFSGTSLEGIKAVKRQPPPWVAVGTGDVNGDGLPDVLWHNPVTGKNEVWYMDDFRMTGKADLPSTPLPWRPVGADDVDGDGAVDLVARNPLTGQNAVGFMNGPTLGTVSMLPAADPAWEFSGSLDLDGNGSVDLLWRNPISGKNEVWYMTGAKRTSTAPLPSAPPPWRGMGGYR